MMKKFKGNKGFSLVELLVALLIMAVIAAIAIGLFGGILDTSKGSSDKETARTIERAIQTYMNSANDMTLASLGGTAVNGNTIVTRLAQKVHIVGADGAAKSEYVDGTVATALIGITADTGSAATPATISSSNNIQSGTYGPLLDGNKIAPQQNGYTGWIIHVHSQTQTVQVSPSNDGTAVAAVIQVTND